jgi:hypothetical protein
MVVYKVKYSANMIVELFRKSQRFPDQPRNPLTERAVESFDMIGLTAVFSDGAVRIFRDGG